MRNVRTVAAASARRWVSRSDASDSVRSSGESPESTSTSPGMRRERVLGRGEGVPGAAGALLHGDLDALELVREVGRADDDEAGGIESPPGLDHPVDEATTEQRVEMLRRGRTHPRAEPSREDDDCQV